MKDLKEQIAEELAKIPKGYVGITDPEAYQRRLVIARIQAEALIPIIKEWYAKAGNSSQ